MRKVFEVGEVVFRESCGEYCEIIREHSVPYQYICRVYETDDDGNETNEREELLTYVDLNS